MKKKISVVVVIAKKKGNINAWNYFNPILGGGGGEVKLPPLY